MERIDLRERTPREQISYWYWKIKSGEATPVQFLIGMELLLLELGVPREEIERKK